MSSHPRYCGHTVHVTDVTPMHVILDDLWGLSYLRLHFSGWCDMSISPHGILLSFDDCDRVPPILYPYRLGEDCSFLFSCQHISWGFCSNFNPALQYRRFAARLLFSVSGYQIINIVNSILIRGIRQSTSFIGSRPKCHCVIITQHLIPIRSHLGETDVYVLVRCRLLATRHNYY